MLEEPERALRQHVVVPREHRAGLVAGPPCWEKLLRQARIDEQKLPKRVHEVGLRLDGQGDVLDKLVGQSVTVSGTLQLEGVSPYYPNGTLILAKSVRLPL